MNNDNNTATIETEIRFGKFLKGKFEPKISREKFLIIKKFMNTVAKDNSIQKNETIQYFALEDSFTLRVIKDMDTQKTTFSKKRKLNNTDDKNFGIRFSSSEEIFLQTYDLKGLEKTFERERTRFSYPYKNMRVDLSKYTLEDNTENFDVEIEFLEPLPDKNDLDWLINQILKIIQGTFIVMNEKEIKSVTPKKFMGSEVITFGSAKEIGKMSDYLCTIKYDGSRKIFLDKGHSVYLLEKKGNPMKIFYNPEIEESETIIDGELMGDIYYMFDILFYKGKDLRSLKFTERLGVLINAFDEYKKREGFHVKISIKEYYENNLATEYKYSPGTDGVVFVKKDSPYSECPIKWKPKEMNTIDFKVKENPLGFWDLYCSKDTMFSYNGYFFNNTEINSNFKSSVIEFSFDKKSEKFVPVRERNDKQDGNYIDVARDNFRTMCSKESLIPFTYNEPPKDFFDMRRFHNFIKRKMLVKTVSDMQNPTLLDLASGKGGDIHKWIDSNIRLVQGYDIDSQSVSEACKRFSKVVSKPVNKNFNFSFEVKDLNKEKVQCNEKYDIISCFFAIHYFDNLKKFTDNFKDCIKKDGIVLITVLCSEELKDMNYLYETFDKKLKISKTSSKKLSINVKIKNSVLDKETKEYVVDKDNLVDIMKSKGFSLLESKLFTEYYPEWNSLCEENVLDYEERKYSFMNRSFIFKKL